MPLKIKNKRKDRRYALPADVGAEIEFDVLDGGHYRLPLLNIDSLGVAFSMPEPIPEIEAGCMLTAAQIHVGSLVIRGNLVVLHIVRDHPSKQKCGAEFHPASDTDRKELVSLLSRLKSMSQLRQT